MPPGDPLDALREGAPGPLYWIHGKERFLVDRAVALIKERVLDPRTRDFNYDLLYGKEAGAQKILGAARTLPMMAKRRLVIVRDADGLDAKQLDALSSYVADPSPETCLVFVADKADQRLKFFTTWKKRGILLKFDPLPERQLAGFVRGEGALRGLRFEVGAADLIADEVGADLGQLVDAVERLELFVGARKQIGPADVEEVVTTTRQRSVFELCDAIGAGDTARALGALGSLLGAREPALRILAMIARAVRQLMQVRDLLDRRAGRQEMMEQLGLPPFVVEKIEAQARRLDAATLRGMHAAVYRADRTLKSSKLDDDRVMELLVLSLARRKPQRAGARA
ncbi:MAG: DNA polymerase III subunit delta [Myxococcales bacterium]|nr:DNA polymerase III subunit delta [Myxococcales bacterium]